MQYYIQALIAELRNELHAYAIIYKFENIQHLMAA
jgi:hypothetical protein